MLQNSWATLCAFAIIGLLVRTVHAQTPKKEEKIRAYEFGFTIDEQQHRHEKRDERGIVMGEFGFITADGIYHVTVYATDEEGKFRILAMRNYPYESPPKTVDMIVKPKPKPAAATTRTPPTPISTTTLQAIIEKKVLPKFNFNTEGCAGCFIKNGPPKDLPQTAEEAKTAIRPLSQPLPLLDLRNSNGIATSPAGGKVQTFNSKLPQIYGGQIVTTANRKAIQNSILSLSSMRTDELPLIFETTIDTLDIDSETPIHITPIVPYTANVAASTITEVKNSVTGSRTPQSYSPTLTALNDIKTPPTTYTATTLDKIPINSKTQTTTQFTPTLLVRKDIAVPQHQLTTTPYAAPVFELSEDVPASQAIPTQTYTPTISNSPTTNEYSTNLLPTLQNTNIPTTYSQTSVATAPQLSTTRYTNTPTSPGLRDAKALIQQTPATQSNKNALTNVPVSFLNQKISSGLAQPNIPSIDSTNTASTLTTAPGQSQIPTIAKTPTSYTNTPTLSIPQAGRLPTAPILGKFINTNTRPATYSTPIFPSTERQSKPFSNVISKQKPTTKISTTPLATTPSAIIPFKTPVTASRINAGVPAAHSKTPETDRTVSYTTPLLNKSPTTYTNPRITPTTQSKTPTLAQLSQSGKPVTTQSRNSPTLQSQIPAPVAAGLSPQSNAQNPIAASGANAAKPSGSGGAQKQPFSGSTPGRPGSGLGGSIGGVGGSGKSGPNGNFGPSGRLGQSGKSGPSGSFGGAGGTGSKTLSGERGDLYRFKYILDYNGHTETGSRNGNKEGNYFAIGEDNVERTIEYVANELGYQPRIRWRKLDAPVPSKENTLKDYEFVWFKEQ